MFSGTITALITPFQAASGGEPQIDYAAYDQLIEWQLSRGVNGFVVAGTTGESATLSADEKVALYSRTVDVVAGRVPVIAGTGSNCTRLSVELSEAAREAKTDGVLLVSPYYNKPTQEGLYQHFSAVAKAAQLPVILYNIPSRAVVEIAPETFERLSRIDNIVAVKQAVDSMEKMLQVQNAVEDRMQLFAGDDALTYFVMSIGGAGVISASSNVIIDEMVAITKEWAAGNYEAALRAQRETLPKIKVLFSETNPAPAKAALLAMGKIASDDLRLPLVPVQEETRKTLHRILAI